MIDTIRLSFEQSHQYGIGIKVIPSFSHATAFWWSLILVFLEMCSPNYSKMGEISLNLHSCDRISAESDALLDTQKQVVVEEHKYQVA